jgi:cytochrome c553
MRRVLKMIGLALGGVLVLLILTVIVLFFVGGARHAERYDAQVASLTIPMNPDGIERGRHLADIHGCTYCHTANLGGQVFVDEPPFRIVAANLTSGAGGVGDRYEPPSWDRAIRHGIGWDGRPLQIMPSAAFHNLSGADAAAIIAYLEQAPAVDNELPDSEIRPLGRVLSAVAMDPAVEVNAGPARSTSPPPGPTREYGEYLSSITCAYCHGADLRGAQPPAPGSPPAPDLAAAGQWRLEDFQHALRTGMTPGGRQLNGEFMPYAVTARMTDEERQALHAHLASLIDSGP